MDFASSSASSSVTNGNKKDNTSATPESSRALEYRIVAIERSCFVLQLVSKSHIDKLVDNLNHLAKGCHADGAVNLTIFIAYADAHALAHDGFFRADVQAKITGNLAIELRYCSTDEKGAFHIVAPVHLGYFEKWLLKDGGNGDVQSVAGDEVPA